MSRTKISQTITTAASALMTLMTGLSGVGYAEDIDLFQINPGNSPPPSVLFLIDNTANWNSTLGAETKRILEHRALATVFSDQAELNDQGEPNPRNFEERMNVGFMVFSDAQPDGGTVVDAVRLLTDDYREHLRTKFAAGVGSRDAGLPKSNNAAYALSMYEAYQYFGGRRPRAGGNDKKNNQIQPDPAAFDGSNYRSPATDSCNNYLVIIANGEPDSGENSGGTPENLLRQIGGLTDTIALQPDDFEAIVADEYSRFFNAADVVPDNILAGVQNLRTYVVDVHDPTSNQAGNRKYRAARAFLRSIALQSGRGAYLPVTSADELLTAIENVLNEIQAENSVFAATALPVSVNVRGTNLNQVYIGVFRPDANRKTRWFGNLKLLNLRVDQSTTPGTVFLADANGNAAQDVTSGFFRQGATSFWTHASTFWDFDPRGTPPSASDSPDGEVVEKGGVAQRLRELGDANGDGNTDNGQAYAPRRNVYTCTTGCNSGSALSSTPFATSNSAINAAALGVTNENDADALINWIRGEDNYFAPTPAGGSAAEDEDGDGLTNDVRASVHGDVLHSQPAIVNYGTRDASGNLGEDVVVFYGANDGMLRAVRGGMGAQTGGQEMWGFVPEEFFPKLNDLRENTEGKSYFADGSLTAYVIDVDGDNSVEPADGDRVLLYSVMRRGGRLVYALDVTNPQNPKYLWRIDNNMAGFSELGQSWSEIRPGRLRGMDAPVLFFGAGYDPVAEDPDPVTGQDDSAAATQGRGLFVVNALTGELLWQVGPAPDTSGSGVSVTESGMQYSMPAAPTVIDRDSDGFMDRVYIPDTGGQVWRINLVDSTVSTGPDYPLWEVGLLASVGAEQEFQYAVDVVAAEPTATYSDRFDAVLVGSGDRENPFDTSITNYFYMFKDVPTDGTGALNSAAPLSRTQLFDATSNAVQDGSGSAREAAINDLNTQQGWFIRLDNTDPDSGGRIGGEKVVGTATTLAGTTFFNTNVPGTTIDCSAALGQARNYAVNFRDASSTLEQDSRPDLTKNDRFKTSGGGFPPSPVPLIVELEDGKQHLGVVSGLTYTNLPNVPLGVRERIYIYNDRLDR